MSAVTVIVKQAAESTEQSIREWAIAVGTVGATAVAVYVGVLREWRRRPTLSLAYGGPEVGDAVVAERQEIGRMTTAYVRLRVEAARGKAAAEEVEVMVLSARETERRQGSPPAPDIAIDGQLLAWSNSLPPRTSLTIPPGVHRHIDLVMVDKGSGTASGIAAAQIEVFPLPMDRRNEVKSSAFELELAVTARNFDARRYRVVVRYDGEWGGDDIWQHLQVEEPRQVDRLRDRLRVRRRNNVGTT